MCPKWKDVTKPVGSRNLPQVRLCLLLLHFQQRERRVIHYDGISDPSGVWWSIWMQIFGSEWWIKMVFFVSWWHFTLLTQKQNLFELLQQNLKMESIHIWRVSSTSGFWILCELAASYCCSLWSLRTAAALTRWPALKWNSIDIRSAL